MKKYKILIATYIIIIHTIITPNPSNLDSSFNQNGAVAFFGAPTVNQAQDLVVQSDGKIVTAGYSGNNAMVVRYNNDGTLDTTFNATGSKPGTIIINLGIQSAAYGIILQLDQKIVIAGYVTDNNNRENAFIARYMNDGSLDRSFNDINGNNTGGYIITTILDQAQLYGICLTPSHKIMVTGWVLNNNVTYACTLRINQNGFFDTSFNNCGYVTSLIGQNFTKSRAIQLQPDNKIIIAGQADIMNNQQLIIIRYNPDGSLDTTFNGLGEFPGTSYPLSNYVTSAALGITLQPDGKIVACGFTNQDDTSFKDRSYTIVRLNSNGTLDTSFNDQETPGYILSTSGLQANDVKIQPDGKIISCGFNYISNYIVIIIRYNNDGTIDPNFNFQINQITHNILANAIALQPDGKIIIGGTVAI